MISRLSICLVSLLIAPFAVHAQTTSQPFASLERAVQAQPGGWTGDKSKLSAVFDSERRRLGARFEPELLKWLGTDVERHYWISYFLDSESYLHGNKRLPHLSLLVKEQGLTLVRYKGDEESEGYVVGLSMTAAILSAELGFSSLAVSYKETAESLLKRNSDLGAHVPAMYDDERRRYDNIPSTIVRPISEIELNPAPEAQMSGGILNKRALKLVEPIFPLGAKEAGASGKVEVNIVYDEQGKVIWAQATRGHPLLRPSAEDAARQTTFPRTKLMGQPVKVKGVLVYELEG